MAHEVVARREVLGPLAERGVELLVAVRPWTTGSAVRVVEAARAAGLRIGLWPMLADADGRWASAHNAAPFAAFVRELLEVLARDGALPDELVLDLEPPIDAMRRLVERGRPSPAPDALRGADAQETFRNLVIDLAAGGVQATAAAIPLILADDERHAGRAGWQRLLGTPVDGVGFSRVEVMLYTSLLEGYSRGLLDRRAACQLLRDLAHRARARYGERASVALGAVWVGALGHEPVYRTVGELADDVAIARAAGIDELSLFDLGGVLRRGPFERWLDAFVHTPAAGRAPRSSLRGRAAWWAATRFGALVRPAR